jgi:hypothetical protein
LKFVKPILLTLISFFVVSILLVSTSSATWDQGNYNDYNNRSVIYTGLGVANSTTVIKNFSLSLNGGEPAVDSSGNIYIHTSDNKLYCVYSDGSVKWTYDSGYGSFSGVCSQVVIDESRNSVFWAMMAPGPSCQVYCNRMDTGAWIWNTDISAYGLYNPGAICDPGTDVIYLLNYGNNPSYSGYLNSLDKVTGVWTQFTGGGYIGYGGGCKPIYDGTCIYVWNEGNGITTDSITCWYASNETVKWFRNFSPYTYFGPVTYYDGCLYCNEQGSGGKIECLHANDGTTKWTRSCSDGVGNGNTYPIVSTYGLVLLVESGLNPTIYELDLETGTIIHSVNFIHETGTFGMSTGIESSDHYWFIHSSTGHIYKININNLIVVVATWINSGNVQTSSSFGVLSDDNILYVVENQELVRFGYASPPSGVYLSIYDYGTVSNPYITLNWTMPTSNGSSPLIGFKLYKSYNNMSFFEFVALSNNTLIYKDSNIVTAINYYYKIRAYNIVGDGIYSNTVKFMIGSTSPNILPGGSLMGDIMPFLAIIFIALFASVIEGRGFSFAMFAVVLGMGFGLLVWIDATTPLFVLAITALLFTAVLFMGHNKQGGDVG